MSSGLSPTRGTTADSSQRTLRLALEWLPGRCRLARKQASALDAARLRSGRQAGISCNAAFASASRAKQHLSWSVRREQQSASPAGPLQ
jgi:hypothetical protein